MRAGRSDERLMFQRLVPLRSVRQARRVISGYYGARLLAETITRACGSRARASWVVLDFAAGAENKSATVVNLIFDARNGWDFCESPLSFAGHALARVTQRTLGAVDLERFAQLVPVHAGAAAMVLAEERIAIGDTIRTVADSGAFIWSAVPGYLAPVALVALTWVTPDIAVEPCLLEAFAIVRGTPNVTVGVEPPECIDRELDS